MLEQLAYVAAIIGGAASVLAILGVLCAGVWFMSGLSADVQAIREAIDKLSEALWGVRDTHAARLNEHEVRIVKLETRD